MKKKLFTLLTLLLCLCSGAWAQETFTFAWTSAGTKGYSYSQAGPTGGSLITNNAIYFLSNEGPKVDDSKLNPYRVGFIFKPTANVTLKIKGSAGSSARTIQNIKIDEELDSRLYTLCKDAVGSSKTVMKYALDNASDDDKAFFATVGILKVNKGVYSEAGDAKSASGQTEQSGLYSARKNANNIAISASSEAEATLTTGTPAVDYTFEAGKYYRIYTEVSSSTGSQLISFKFTTTAPSAPSITPTAAEVVKGQEITMSSTTSGAAIYYTTDGETTPTSASTLYDANSKPAVTAATTFKAIAIKDNTSSNVTTKAYTVRNAYAPTPDITAGTVAAGTQVELTSSDGGTIYYTTNGDEPTTESTPYEGKITINSTTTIKAKAYVNGYLGDMATLSYTVKSAPGIEYGTTAVEKYIGDANFTNALTNPNTLTVAYSISTNGTGSTINESTGEVTVGNAAGEETVTATFTENDTYVGAEVNYTLTIKAVPAISNASPASGSTVNGKSKVTLTGVGTISYQWKETGDEAPTAAGEGWTEGSVATVPNVDGDRVLYAFATDGTRNSDVSSFTYTINALEEQTKTWDFTNWSSATIAGTGGDTDKWYDHEKSDGTGVDFTNGKGAVNKTAAAGTLKYESTNIAETEGLNFTADAYQMALVYNVSSALNDYNGSQYIWLFKSASKITIPSVPANSTIEIGVETHKATDARGVTLKNGSTSLEQVQGSAKSTEYQVCKWTNIATDGDVTITPSAGLHIYYIKIYTDTPKEEVTVSAANYKSYNTTMPTDFSKTDGVQAFIVTAATTSSITLTEVTAVPANTPVILKTAGDYTLHGTAWAPAVTGNKLQISNGTVAGNGSTRYALANIDNVPGFYLVSDGLTIPTSYVEITGGGEARSFVPMSTEGTTTGIANLDVNANVDANTPMYNLAGQRVNKSYKGVVIVNGKKMLNK
ncbi:MAG: chitobiase/beta-hexosaminidase C-terminal domain-containing protein [Prevotella sp.]|nr:chitobiase/beta-hexosaminidase C-terminal domain-containing protein [Prevotella sp.]